MDIFKSNIVFLQYAPASVFGILVSAVCFLSLVENVTSARVTEPPRVKRHNMTPVHRCRYRPCSAANSSYYEMECIKIHTSIGIGTQMFNEALYTENLEILRKRIEIH